MTPAASPAAVGYSASQRPHLAEWFGHRVFPVVATHATATTDQRNGRCPFLTETLRQPTICVKQPNSQGVCTISAESNGRRQDWLVCPYRALDDSLLATMTKRLYGIPAGQDIVVTPAVTLSEPEATGKLLLLPQGVRIFAYFQDKLGGEIGLPRSPASPELSFDITIVELLPPPPGSPPGTGIQLGRYGVIELQTTDTHGSYKHAVTALRGALDLHPNDFAGQLAANPEWAGRRVEGPNISNVFKRTFYQIAFKFQVTRRDASAGCALALPQPVWDSWQPFLGRPDLHKQPDGTWRLLDDHSTAPTGWIYVFDIAAEPGPGGEPAPIDIRLVIGTDAATLSRAALDIAPARAIARSPGRDAVLDTLNRRLRTYLPDLETPTV